MYHGAGYRKLGKKSNHRMAMFANATNSLIEHGRIETTLPKAKDLRARLPTPPPPTDRPQTLPHPQERPPIKLTLIHPAPTHPARTQPKWTHLD